MPRLKVAPCELDRGETGSVNELLRPQTSVKLRACGAEASLEKLTALIKNIRPGIDVLWAREWSDVGTMNKGTDHTEDYFSLIGRGNQLTNQLCGQTKLHRNQLRENFGRVIKELGNLPNVINAERQHFQVKGEIARIYAANPDWSFKLSLDYNKPKMKKVLEVLTAHLPYASTMIFSKVHERGCGCCSGEQAREVQFFAYLN